MRRTKIVATVGPASSDGATLRQLMVAGLDVVRLNASHAAVDELDRVATLVRETAASVGKNVAIMVDLPGPKLRIGPVEEGAALEPGAGFTLESADCMGNSYRACLTYKQLPADVSPGDRVLLDDGRLELEVTETQANEVRTKVVVGGPLSGNKGVNVPGVRLNIDALTDADRAAATWAVGFGVEYIAQSFVRTAEDVRRLRELLGDADVALVAKIEKHEAVPEIGQIVREADAVMVARGDLGVETSPEEVPVLQRRIITEARQAGRPVIVATQMLESMVASPRPTRAEASDVATAIFQRADAVMLSAETAIGRYPVRAVETMARIADRAEAEVVPVAYDRRAGGEGSEVTRAVSAAVCDLAEHLSVSAIITATQSGATARAVARHRPAQRIVAVTPSPVVARRLALVWGVASVLAPVAAEEDLGLHGLTVAARDAGWVDPGVRVAITAGVARGVPGTTDLILVREVPE